VINEVCCIVDRAGRTGRACSVARNFLVALCDALPHEASRGAFAKALDEVPWDILKRDPLQWAWQVHESVNDTMALPRDHRLPLIVFRKRAHVYATFAGDTEVEYFVRFMYSAAVRDREAGERAVDALSALDRL